MVKEPIMRAVAKIHFRLLKRIPLRWFRVLCKQLATEFFVNSHAAGVLICAKHFVESFNFQIL